MKVLLRADRAFRLRELHLLLLSRSADGKTSSGGGGLCIASALARVLARARCAACHHDSRCNRLVRRSKLGKRRKLYTNALWKLVEGQKIRQMGDATRMNLETVASGQRGFAARQG